MKRWKVKLGPDRMPVELVDRGLYGGEYKKDLKRKYFSPMQYAPGYVYVSAIDEMGAFLEAIKWTEQHPL